MPSIRSLYSIVKAGVKSVKFFVKAMWFTFNHSGIICKMRAVISGEIFYSCQFWCCYGSFIMECFIMEVTTNTKDDRWIEPMLVARFFEDTLIILNKLLLLASVFLLGKCLLPMFFSRPLFEICQCRPVSFVRVQLVATRFSSLIISIIISF